MTLVHDAVSRIADEIEAELRLLGWWDLPEPPPAFDAAFGADVMTFPQWIRFVLLSRIRQIVAEVGEFPASSSVGTQATRELDGDERAQRLGSLLSKLDGVVTARGGTMTSTEYRAWLRSIVERGSGVPRG